MNPMVCQAYQRVNAFVLAYYKYYTIRSRSHGHSIPDAIAETWDGLLQDAEVFFERYEEMR